MNEMIESKYFNNKFIKRGLILAVHGSRKIETTQEIISLADRLQQKIKSDFKNVCPGFLEFGTPKINDVIQDFIKEGITEIIVFPFFIASGTHILVDIPNLIKENKAKYPHITFIITQHLGASQKVEDLILQQILNKTNFEKIY